MAIVNLKDVKVTGTFSRGIRVVEESKGRDGKGYSTRWTVWSDTLGVREGDIVSLSGFLSAKVNDWTDKDGVERHSVELSLNSPRLEGQSGQETGREGSNGHGVGVYTSSDVSGPQAGAQSHTSPVVDEWNPETAGAPF